MEIAIQAGSRMIATKGYSQFSIRGVAQDIGYTVGTLSYLFGNIDDFLLQINSRTLDECYESMAKALGDGGRDPIQVLARSYCDFAHSNSHRWLALYEHRMGVDREIPEWYRQKLNRLFALLEGALRDLLGLKPASASRVAHVLWASIHGVCILSISGKLQSVEAKDTSHQMIRFLVDTFLSGLSRSK